MSIKIFFCYAHEDESFLDKLKTHLSPLQWQGLIEPWHDRDISAGTEWEEEIKKQLNTAQIIILLVSPDFMASKYCYSVEMKRAVERHERGEARVIPVILRHIYWQAAPFGKLQALPKEAKPVKSWPDQDEAFFNVAEGIRKALDNRKTKEEWLKEGDAQHKAGHYEEALFAYEQALQIDENFVRAWAGKGEALRGCQRFEDALAAFERAIRLDSENASLYVRKGDALNDVGNLTEALAAFEKAIELDSNYMWAWQNKALVLERLAQRTPEKAELFNRLAQQAFEKARQLGYRR